MPSAMFVADEDGRCSLQWEPYTKRGELMLIDGRMQLVGMAVCVVCGIASDYGVTRDEAEGVEPGECVGSE